MIISSRDNKKLKEIRKLVKSRKQRDALKCFVCEGSRTIVEADEGVILSILYSSSFKKREEKLLEDLLKKHNNAQIYEVSDEIFDTLSDTKTPQGIMAVCRKQQVFLEDFLENDGYKTFVVLENIQDPGNLGTIVRSSEACDVTAVILTEGCADYYNPKVIRSTMGTVFRVPVIEGADVVSLIDEFKKADIRTYAADLQQSTSLYEEEFAKRNAIFIGNEGNGLKRSTVELCDGSIRIPMGGKVESLNASIAASVILYEIKRQRAAKS